MQVFIVGTPYETAETLDVRRLHKQIVECHQILAALNGAKAWSNHPCVLQYKGHEKWLLNYMYCLIGYSKGDILFALNSNHNCKQLTPSFHTQEYFNQMKRRLYTKNNQYYSQWAELGESDCNWYWSDYENKFIKYINGKRIE
jgi:hypothetical protein